MTSSENINQITIQALGLTMATRRNEVVDLLKKYGVAIDKSYADRDIITALLIACSKDERFKAECTNLMSEAMMSQAGAADIAADKAFTGESQQRFFPANASRKSFTGETEQHFFPASSLTDANNTSTTGKTGVGKFLDANLDKILNTGLTTISTIATNKSNQKLAQTALQIEQEKTRQAELVAAGGGAGFGTAKKGLSTGAKIGIGLGVAGVIGTIIYFLVKKKK